MKIKRYIATVTAIILCLLALALSACGTGLKTVKVTFDYNDGATPDKIVEVEQGSTVEKPKPPTRDGHIFVGWYLDGEEYDFGEAVNSDVTLTAEWEENDHVVTIIIYDGNTVKRTVSDGEKVKAPDVPEREGFEFDGWYSDENFTKEYNFDSPVKNDFTIYGKWKDVSVTYYKVTYNYNYEGAIPNSTSVEEGSKAVKPAIDPVRADYKFLGWFTTADGDTEYNFETAVTADTEIFAHWEQIIIEGVKNYVFEAELTDLTDFEGSGFSNEAKGRQAIQDSKGEDVKASNGYWVGYLYKTGCSLTFVINSDKDVNDVTLKIRLSGEIVNQVRVKNTEFKIALNGKQLKYNDIVLNGIPTGVGAPPAAFNDFELGANLSLKAGENTVTVTVENNVPLAGSDGIQAGGKIQATAPLVDCIKITTAANLSWNPWFEGLEKKYGWDRDTDYKGIIDTEAQV